MKVKTLIAASMLVPGLALAAVPHHHHSLAAHTYRVEPGLYVRAEAGISKPSFTVEKYQPNPGDTSSTVSFSAKDSFVGGLGLGYTFNEFFRSDLMVGYRRLQVKGSPLKGRVYTYLVNAYFDGQNATMFTPYVMGGIGLGHDHFKAAGSKGKTRFAWNAGAGVYAKVANNINIDLNYKYLGVKLSKITTQGQTVKARIGANEFQAGLIFKF
jgi:opacity protein-like surface antigen